MDQIYTVSEAATKLGMTKARVLRKLQRGELHGTKRGWNWFISSEDLERFRQRISARSIRSN